MMVYKNEQNRSLGKTVMLFLFKWLSIFIISFMISVFVMILMDFGTWSFIFVFVAFQMILWKLLHKANTISIMIADSLFIFLVILMKLYVTVGPNI